MTDQTVPAIELRGVHKAFGTLRVLDDVSLSIPAGRGFCILGRSGTGKSVMLKHIIGLMEPDAGQVLVEGRDITGLSSRALSPVRQRIGFLFQNAALFDSITVGENVAFPMRRHTRQSDDEIRARASSLLEQVGLGRDFDKMPADLSGGMRKRAGLARAMALEPAILLADEPSAGLDPVTAGEIDQLLVTLKHGAQTTLVVVTHNIPSARAIGDELLFLHQGRVLARGTAAELDRERARDGPRVHGIDRLGLAGSTETATMRARTRTAIVGAFVLGGLMLFAAGLFMIGDRRLLFAEHFEVRTTFTKVSGLEVGTQVRVAGLPAGEVLEIALPARPSEPFIVRMRLRDDIRHLVRTDSVCAVQSDGLVGSAFIQVSPGTDAAPVVTGGQTIRGIDMIEIGDLIHEGRETFRTVTTEVMALKGDVSQAVTAATDAVRTVDKVIDNVGTELETMVQVWKAGRRPGAEGARGCRAGPRQGQGRRGDHRKARDRRCAVSAGGRHRSRNREDHGQSAGGDGARADDLRQHHGARQHGAAGPALDSGHAH